MIKYEFNIGQWGIHLFIALDTYHIGEIIEQLWKLHCNKVQTFNAYQLMKQKSHNVGFTYSNLFQRQSVMVIGIHDTKSQLINTIAHESRHLQQHIADVYKIKADSEQVCYLIGAINQIIFDCCNSLNLFD